MKRHRLVCLKRLSDAALVDSPLSQPSPPSNEVNRVPIDNSPSNSSGRNVNRSLGNFTCDICGRRHGNMENLNAHRSVHLNVSPGIPTSLSNDFATIRIGVDALDQHLCIYDLKSNEPCSDVLQFFQMSTDLVKELFRSLSSTYVIQAKMTAQAKFIRVDNEGRRLDETLLFFQSPPLSYVNGDGETWYDSHSRAIIETMDNFQRRSSNLEFDSIERVEIKMILRENVDGQGIFPLPPNLSKKRAAIINVDSLSKCFNFALLSILHYNEVPDEKRRDPSSYTRWVNDLDFGDLDVENIKITDVHKIEILNKIKINIHVWEGKTLTIRYNNKQVVAPKTINLLLVCNQGLRHYCGIISLKRLYNSGKGYEKKGQFDFCERCCRKISNSNKPAADLKKKMALHYKYCREGRLQLEALPQEKEFSYKNFSAEESPVVVCYSDIESYIEPQTKKHCPSMIGLYPVYHEHFNKKREQASMRAWSGERCIKSFLVYLDRFVRELDQEMLSLTSQPMVISPSDQRAFDNATHCPKCKTAFTLEGKHIKVRDHCHITGKYRGPLCHVCNSRLRLKRRVLPVVFHNFKGYDGHLICKQAIGELKEWNLNVIPCTHEKYMCVSANVPVGRTKAGKLRYFTILFLDSFQFLSSSLASLVDNLTDLPFTERRMRARFPNISNDVLRRKGVFPYSYFDSPSRLQETSLPPIESFKDDLSGAECTPDEYAHAQRAWSELGCHSFREYLAGYLFLDIYLLTDVFEEFRRVSLREDGLDPVHFVSLPGLSYTACFKRTGESIDLLQDIDMIRLFERGIRGGLTFVNKHHVQAHIPELNNNQDGNVHLTYIDENNLYGSSLCRPLPHSEFSWVDAEGLKQFSDPQQILNLEDEGDYGYLFEVDLVYPRELHETTAAFPLAPEHDYIEEDMFSPFMKSYYSSLCHARGVKDRYQCYRKLLMTQYDKERYVCHYSILKFYIRMGLKLQRVHSAIRFRQKRFVEPYIKYNSEKRALARNAFEKDYYKLKNNSFFGKTMEDVRHRIKYKLCSSWDKVDKLTASPLCIDFDIFSEDVVGIHMFNDKVILNKPVYIGFSVLEHSKLEMYTLYYDILHNCPLIRQPELVGGDTDSFFLALHTSKETSLSDIFQSLRQYFDSSNYPSDHILYSAANKAKLGCFKDETAGKCIEEMILLRPKMYSMKYLGEDAGIRRAKGISRHIVKSTSHQSYQAAFHNQTESSINMTIIRSHLHTVKTVTFRKRGLSAWEDKRCWLDANSSVPHGSHLSGLPPKRRRVFPTPPSGDVN